MKNTPQTSIPLNLDDAVQSVLKDARLRDELVEGSFAKNETYRYNCVRVLFRAIESQPGLFYPYWDRFAEAIDSSNGFHRSVGAQAIAHLASVDTDRRLDPIFNHYLKLLDDSKVMVSHYFLETMPLIYCARPDFQSKVIACLFGIEKTTHPTSRKDLLKADVINIFDQLFDTLSEKDKKRVSAFARDQLECSSSKTRKAAKEFGMKHK